MAVLSMWAWVVKHKVYLLSIILWKEKVYFGLMHESFIYLTPAICIYPKCSLLLSLLFYSSFCTTANANITFWVWKLLMVLMYLYCTVLVKYSGWTLCSSRLLRRKFHLVRVEEGWFLCWALAGHEKCGRAVEVTSKLIFGGPMNSHNKLQFL